ncbi:flavin reductase (DIM6/NTAB) family NADH-FMN oxidoreductase RutF [Algoriphagus ratkowskyi]|uniref:Flavin oxidoreductase n=1 Tax=Algoriphagus ratkowskyi TaxID=57028 RepID=A0A2W7QXX3_9BACT|nr:flavin reductase [Algoriphagus ratkowskyi]PZX53383.1 flavin reductase (DIM6/NTAB) family NADH-FMN oxidoreductase RutF [Algoriphagus ratkowskyi]TXD76572.1 flavin oxidoreductase [Algoriphagus ratkowskyi]
MQLHKIQIESLERKYKLNLINSISGIKPANLIGTKSLAGNENVAIFSSVVHLGSSPAQLAFIMRPQSEFPRDTYSNILETEFYTINHVSESFIEKAHYTSAKLERSESEFDRMKLEKEFIGGFHAPFVKDSPVKIGMKHLESIPLPNGCLFVIGSVEMLVLPDEAINELGQLDLQHSSGVGISGLNSYYGLTRLNSFPYVREEEIPNYK